MSDKIFVQTSTEKNYNLHFGYDLSEVLKEYISSYSAKKAFVLVDAFVLKNHRAHFEKVLKKKFPELQIFEVPRGEKAKSFEIYNKAVDFVLGKGVERATPLFAIGGGVTGDLAGFVAATVLRGIPLIHIPTTLLAMVDSSIGGKTGINHSVGKNLIGSFYQPDAVFADVKYLETLPQEEWVNGLSEVLKYGMIHSPEILEQINTLIDDESFTDGKAWLSLIRQSAQIKTDIVAEDVLEAGKRAFLNFGHTFAHVIEKEGNFSEYSHGEAVYAGMIAAVYASNKLGGRIELSNLLQFKSLYDLSLDTILVSPAELVEGMKADKKVKDEQIQLILLKEPGSPYLYKVLETEFVEQTWEHTLKIFR
ncbi:MAG: 3-dehydroquinate synthase [Gracilimonas sp.]|uniref:3-dehydroquinate synthase n=1 Tax=Gracilimonas sp. TaxID=1974203 RepID=UPI0019BF69E8|nr:3-dehydroquinate synthase [Gracilimonas sp.]MBD3616035.1 3-dehydroquinate synthase [Gracilimonas sp.]